LIGYGFHPEASVDVDEIWEFIAADSLDAADKLMQDILDAVDVLVAFPHQGYRRPEPHLGPAAVQTGARIM
jgi:plasmid stabilization system protein ParE